MNTLYETLRRLKAHETPVTHLIFSPDSNRLVTGSKDETVKIWDVNSLRCLNRLSCKKGSLESIAFNQKGEAQAIQKIYHPAYHEIKVLNIASGKIIAISQVNNGELVEFKVSRDGASIAYGSKKGETKTWHIPDNQFMDLPAQESGFQCSAFSPNGKIFTTVKPGKSTNVWSVPADKCLFSLPEGMLNVDFNSNSEQLAAVGNNGHVGIWNCSDGSLVRLLIGHLQAVSLVTFNADNTLLATGALSPENTIKIWDVNTGQCLATLPRSENEIRHLAFSPDASMLLVCSGDEAVEIWGVQSRRYLKKLTKLKGKTESFAFSPDSTKLAIGDSDGNVNLFFLKNVVATPHFDKHPKDKPRGVYDSIVDYQL
jgi:WD40 repeat protein